MSDRLITKKEVRHLCGGVSEATLWRWQRDPSINFPKSFGFGQKVFFKESEISAWIDGLGAEARA